MKEIPSSVCGGGGGGGGGTDAIMSRLRASFIVNWNSSLKNLYVILCHTSFCST